MLGADRPQHASTSRVYWLIRQFFSAPCTRQPVYFQTISGRLAFYLCCDSAEAIFPRWGMFCVEATHRRHCRAFVAAIAVIALLPPGRSRAH